MQGAKRWNRIYPSNIEILGQFCRRTDHRFWGESGNRYRNCEKISVFTEPMHRFFPRTDDRYCGGTASLMPQISGEPAAVQICRLTDKLIYPRHAAEMPRTRGGPAAVPSNGISWTNFRKESVYSKFKIYFYRFIVSPFQEYTATKT